MALKPEQDQEPLPALAPGPSPSVPACFEPPGSERAKFRAAFLTASTWNQTTATEKELVYAMQQWKPGQEVSFALSRLLSRRELDRRGLLRKQERAAKEAADEL